MVGIGVWNVFPECYLASHSILAISNWYGTRKNDRSACRQLCTLYVVMVLSPAGSLFSFLVINLSSRFLAVQ